MGPYRSSQPSSTRRGPLSEHGALTRTSGPARPGERRPRGEPVVALAMILAIWIAVRATFIALEPDLAPRGHELAVIGGEGGTRRTGIEQAGAQQAGVRQNGAPLLPTRHRPVPPHHDAGLATLAMSYAQRRSGIAAVRRWSGEPAGEYLGPLAAGPMAMLPAGATQADDRTTGPQAAALFAMPPPAPPKPADGVAAEAGPQRRPRWSADGWVLVRGGDSLPALATGAASYGASQAGGVLRYDLAPASPLRPRAYLRLSAALGGRARQGESALGLMVRPVRRMPVVVLGEMRLQRSAGATRSRPVVMLVSELPPITLPLEVEGDLYVQGGWAGGRDATGFYDLAATVQRRVSIPVRGIRLSAGGGVWSGGQRGAARLDAGPRIELRGMLGPASRPIGVRVGLDWRFRVAGRADPGSGPALTVAAGF